MQLTSPSQFLHRARTVPFAFKMAKARVEPFKTEFYAYIKPLTVP